MLCQGSLAQLSTCYYRPPYIHHVTPQATEGGSEQPHCREPRQLPKQNLLLPDFSVTSCILHCPSCFHPLWTSPRGACPGISLRQREKFQPRGRNLGQVPTWTPADNISVNPTASEPVPLLQNSSQRGHHRVHTHTNNKA